MHPPQAERYRGGQSNSGTSVALFWCARLKYRSQSEQVVRAWKLQAQKIGLTIDSMTHSSYAVLEQCLIVRVRYFVLATKDNIALSIAVRDIEYLLPHRYPIAHIHINLVVVVGVDIVDGAVPPRADPHV